jgi:hypothetical protein
MNCPDCGYPVEKSLSYCPKCFARTEPQGWWRRFLSLLGVGRRSPDAVIHVDRDIIIDTTDEEGQQHEYHSLDEVPPEVRAEIEKLKSEPWKEISRSFSSDGHRTEIVREKTLSTFKFTDEMGNERLYRSLEEMPPELRAAVEEAERRNPGPGDGTTSSEA